MSQINPESFLLAFTGDHAYKISRLVEHAQGQINKCHRDISLGNWRRYNASR